MQHSWNGNAETASCGYFTALTRMSCESKLAEKELKTKLCRWLHMTTNSPHTAANVSFNPPVMLQVNFTRFSFLSGRKT